MRTKVKGNDARFEGLYEPLAARGDPNDRNLPGINSATLLDANRVSSNDPTGPDIDPAPGRITVLWNPLLMTRRGFLIARSQASTAGGKQRVLGENSTIQRFELSQASGSVPDLGDLLLLVSD
jgi:hypothetical protein